MVSNFPEIVKRHLSHLPEDDYPVLNTFLFVSTWLHFVLDQGETSMRSVFKRLSVRGINVDISTGASQLGKFALIPWPLLPSRAKGSLQSEMHPISTFSKASKKRDSQVFYQCLGCGKFFKGDR